MLYLTMLGTRKTMLKAEEAANVQDGRGMGLLFSWTHS